MAGLADKAAVEPTSTSEPWPFRSTSRKNPRAVRNVAVRFWRSVRSQRSSGSRETGTSSDGHTPATAAQTSIRPSAVRASSKRRSTSRLVGQVGAEHRCAVECGRELAGARLAAVVVERDSCALGRERAGAGGADPPEAPVTSTPLPERPVSTSA